MNVNPKAHGNIKEVVPFLHVSSMERSVRYYVDGLGFTMTNQWVIEGNCAGAGWRSAVPR